MSKGISRLTDLITPKSKLINTLEACLSQAEIDVRNLRRALGGRV